MVFNDKFYSLQHLQICTTDNSQQNKLPNNRINAYRYIYIHTHMIGINQQPFNLRVVYDLFANRHNLTLSSCDFQ